MEKKTGDDAEEGSLRKGSNFSFQELVDCERVSSEIPLPSKLEVLPSTSIQESENPFTFDSQMPSEKIDHLEETYNKMIEGVKFSRNYSMKA